jgi:hypothetical protein
VITEMLDQVDLQVDLDPEAFQVFLEKRVRVVEMENQEPQDLQGLLVSEGLRGCLVFRDQKDTEDSLAWMVPREHQVRMELRERMELLVLLEILDLWDQWDPEEREVGMDHLALLASEVLMEPWDLLEKLDLLERLVVWECLEFLEPRVTAVLLDQREVLGYRVLEENLESLDKLVIQV